MSDPIPRLYRVPSPGGPRLVLSRGKRHVDLSAHLGPRAPDFQAMLGEGLLEEGRLLALLERGDLPPAEAPAEVLTPLPPREVGKILALGKNFRAHAEEFGEPVPEEPLFFNKLPETLVPHGAAVRVPAWYTGRVDHEAELAVVIGREGRDLAPEQALAYVAGYTVANDLTARTLQGEDRARKHPWLRSKNMDGFCPLGPCLVPRDFLDLSDLRVRARVRRPGGGAPELRQDASTADLIVDVPRAVAWLSRHLTLRPGDLVLMGTPAGVGPLADGDEVICSVEGIGELATRIERPR
jgi:2-keto-4-pentenoate hydratase/2-oxohepta-3-ene-1,7-dioic acid hydratase in catechol pathway